MKQSITRIATPALGVAMISGVAIAGVALPAQAAVAAKPAAHTVAAKKPAPKPQKRALAKPNNVVGAAAINRYQIGAGQMQQIMAANRFAQTPKPRAIRARESRGNYRIVSSNGRYAGAYQYDRSTWQRMGGGLYSPTANLAPAWAQDYIMYRTVQSYGWGPWGG